MARVLYGSLVTAVKGSIGGVTFQGNPSGSIIRSRPHLSKSSSTKQTRSHGSLQNLLYQWQALSQVQRDNWNTYAATWTKVNKFGQDKTLTGLNWFTSVNFFQYATRVPFNADPPPHDLPASPPSFTVIPTATTLSVNVLDSFDFDTNALIIWATIPTRVNTLSINQERKFLSIITELPVNPLDITSLWESATGLTWNPVDNFPVCNIYVCLQALRLSSNITSAMLCTKNSLSVDDDSMLIFTCY